MKKLIFIFLLLINFSTFSQTEIIQDGSFATPTSDMSNIKWTWNPNFYYNENYSNWHSAPGYAYLATSTGVAGNNLDGEIWQSLNNLPNNITSFTLSYYYSVSTNETTTSTEYDYVDAFLLIDGSEYFLNRFSNLDNNNGSYDLLSQTFTGSLVDNINNASNYVTLLFRGYTDGASESVMRIDDVSFIVYTSTSNDYDLRITNESVNNTNVNVGDQIDVSCRQRFSGDCNCNYLDPNPYVGFFLSTNQTYESGVDIVIGTEYSTIGNNDSNDPVSINNWTIPSSITAGNYYILFVADYNNQHNETNESNNTEYVPITINGSSCTGVTITQQPTNQTVTSGNSATFSVTATGTAPITYQWTENGSNISGATSSTYTTPTLTTSDSENSYMCKVTNCDGTVNSNVATVTVTSSCIAVGISQQPQNQTANVGNTATFSVTTNGTVPFTYQWKKNGSNISGATNSTYTTPTLALSDNGNSYSCFITNCSNSYNITSNSATLTVSNNSLSELTIETTNSTFPNDKTLYIGTSNPDYIKVCADGTKSTRFILVNNSGTQNESIGFKVVPDNSDISEYGTFASSDIDPNGANNTIEALYTHPTTFPNSADYNDSRSIEIYNINNPSSILFTIPLRIYKAPVLLVHGLWGDASGFDDMENHLFNVGYNSTLTKKVNYCLDAGNSFNENSWVVPNNIIALLDQCRTHNFSSGKVDIVSHSMGGILSRAYIQAQSIDYVGNVNRLITLNTPHSGSPLGNLALNSDIDSFIMDINTILNGGYVFHCDPSITDGAVYDLAIGSDAMTELNVDFLNNNVVPSHTVTTKFNITSIQAYFINQIAEILIPELDPNENVEGFIDNLFDGSPHDFIVSIPSQQGGLTGDATQLMNGQIWHIGAQEQPEVINYVSSLLQQNPLSSYFEQNGFSPANVTANYRSSIVSNRASSSSNEFIPNSIFINTPIENSLFNVGETVDINITSTNGINRIIFYAIDPINENYFKEEFQSTQVDTQYTITNDTYENINLLALGFNDNGLVDYEIKTIGVNTNITVTGIDFLDSEIHIQKGFITPISISEIYSNGDRKLLTDLSGVQLTINDNNIAEQYESNFLKGNNLGETTLTASYLGYTISSPVAVYESNIEMPDLSTMSNSDFKIPTTDGNLLIYPNPNSGQFTINLDSHPNEKIKIVVYNSIGQKISTFENEYTNGNNIKNISFKNLNSGVYYVKVFFGTDNKIGKIIIE